MKYVLWVCRVAHQDRLEKAGEAHRVVGLDLCLEIGNDGILFQGDDGDIQPFQPTSHLIERVQFSLVCKMQGFILGLVTEVQLVILIFSVVESLLDRRR